MGFGAVLDMADHKLPRRVLLWLIKKVDCKTMSLVLKNHRISILDVVKEILKFPVSELDVDMPPAGNHRHKAFIKFNKFRSEKAGRGQPLREEEELLVTYTEPDDKDKFWFSFMEVMYVDLVKRTHIVVQEGIPCIKFFTNESLEDLASLCRKRNRNDDQFFEELLDNDKLSQFPLVESNNEPEEKDPDSEDEVPPSPTKKKKYSKREIKENSSEPMELMQPSSNLQKAYTKAHGVDSPNIEQMKKHYTTVGLQLTNKDCGFWVGRALQCHNGKDIVGNNKISIGLFRKEICYVLLYYAYNDLNPRRDGLAALLKAAALGSK